MKRYLQLSVTAVLAAAAVAVAPVISPVLAQTQTRPIVEELNLTEEQQAEIEAVLASRRAEVDAILTDEQQQQFRQAMQERQGFRSAVGAIDNLTDAQKESLRAVFQSARQEISGILTDEQRAEARTLIQDRHPNLQERRQNRQ
jgi:Spy/CpxP family protein refolding chaperone